MPWLVIAGNAHYLLLQMSNSTSASSLSLSFLEFFTRSTLLIAAS